MPPVTRRALRSNTSLVDNNDTPTTKAESLISETATNNNARPVLGEVAGNNSEATTAANGLTAEERPTKKLTAKRNGAKKGKGNSATRKDNSKLETTQQGTGNTAIMLPEEENQPLPEGKVIGDSEAGAGSPEPMFGEEHQKGAVSMRGVTAFPPCSGSVYKRCTCGEIEIFPEPEVGGTLDIQSPAGQSTEDRLSPSQSKTPKFDPNVHVSPATDNLAEEAEDSFLESIVKRSPRRLSDGGDLPDAPEYSISPSRQPSRIEDSVEAIDALEDALEQIGQALPNVDNGFDSPVRGQSPTESVESVGANQTSGTKTKVSSVRNKRVEPNGRASKPEPPATRRTAASKTSQTNRNPVHRSSSRSQTTGSQARTVSPRKPGNTPSTASKKAGNPTSTATTKESKTPIAKKEKPQVDPSSLSTSKPGFVPVKSTKAPTRAEFELPGEAISRRKREQREEKARQEEEEKQRKRAFKAKPVRISAVPSVAVKENAVSRSRARASLIGDDLAAQDAPSPSAWSKRHTAVDTPTRSSSFQSVGSAASKRNSLLGVSKRTSLTSLVTRASSVSRGPPAAGSPTVSVSHEAAEVDQDAGEVTTPTKRSGNVTPVNRGKEFFRRDQLQREERERERREKEEAAKRARTEAAERGRLASREWAERQRLRKLSGK